MHHNSYLWVSNGVFTPEQDNKTNVEPVHSYDAFHTNGKTNVEPVHSYDAFHTRSDKPGVKGIIGMHRFNICLVVVLLWCENTRRPTLFASLTCTQTACNLRKLTCKLGGGGMVR